MVIKNHELNLQYSTLASHAQLNFLTTPSIPYEYIKQIDIESSNYEHQLYIWC